MCICESCDALAVYFFIALYTNSSTKGPACSRGNTHQVDAATGGANAYQRTQVTTNKRSGDTQCHGDKQPAAIFPGISHLASAPAISPRTIHDSIPIIFLRSSNEPHRNDSPAGRS